MFVFTVVSVALDVGLNRFMFCFHLILWRWGCDDTTVRKDLTSSELIGFLFSDK